VSGLSQSSRDERSEMWSSDGQKIEKLSMPLPGRHHVCFILLLSTRRASPHETSPLLAGTSRSPSSSLGCTSAPSGAEQFTPEAGESALASVETGQHLRAQLDLTETRWMTSRRTSGTARAPSIANGKPWNTRMFHSVEWTFQRWHMAPPCLDNLSSSSCLWSSCRNRPCRWIASC
jgi:hypothetical protein